MRPNRLASVTNSAYMPPRQGHRRLMKTPQAPKQPKHVKEFFLASLLVRVPGKRGRHA